MVCQKNIERFILEEFYMKKKTLSILLLSLFLLPTLPVYAQNKTENDSKIIELKKQIEAKKKELAELEQELELFLPHDDYKLGEIFNNEAFEFTIKYSTNKKIEKDYLRFEADAIFATFDIEFKNISKESMSLDGGAFKLVHDDAEYSTTILLGESISYERVNPGIKKEGRIFFDIPEDIANSADLKLVYTPNFSSDGKEFELIIK